MNQIRQEGDNYHIGQVDTDQFGADEPPAKDEREELQTLENIAELGWSAHIAWEKIIGELPHPEWSQLGDAKRQEVLDLTRWILDHPYASVAAQHDNWRAMKATQGWSIGEEKNTSLRQHPNMEKFENLPFSQQRKAHLWRHVVHAIVG